MTEQNGYIFHMEGEETEFILIFYPRFYRWFIEEKELKKVVLSFKYKTNQIKLFNSNLIINLFN